MVNTISTKLVTKRFVTSNIIEAGFEVPEDFKYRPGQYIGVYLDHPFKRLYSIVELENSVVKILIDAKNPGKGADFFRKAELGDLIKIDYPTGDFSCNDNDLEKVFVSAGAGIAPFIPMIREIIDDDPSKEVSLFNGIAHHEDDLAIKYLEDLIKMGRIHYYRCVTRENTQDIEFSYSGRVTKVVFEEIANLNNKEFYISGGKNLIDDMSNLLGERKVTQFYFENYG